MDGLELVLDAAAAGSGGRGLVHVHPEGPLERPLLFEAALRGRGTGSLGTGSELVRVQALDGAPGLAVLVVLLVAGALAGDAERVAVADGQGGRVGVLGGVGGLGPDRLPHDPGRRGRGCSSILVSRIVLAQGGLTAKFAGRLQKRKAEK